MLCLTTRLNKKRRYEIFVFLSAFLFSFFCKAQNLVSNGDFETYTSCPTATSTPADKQISKAAPWTTPTNGTADFYHKGAPCNFAPEEACSGSGYGGIFTYIDGSIPGFAAFANYREYLSCPLTQSLDAGKVYCISFSIKRFTFRGNMASDGIGFYFSNGPIPNPGNDKALPYVPQYQTPKGKILQADAGCVVINGTFCASGGERYITIGNFNNDVNTNVFHDGRPQNATSGGPLWPAAYYQIDNVVVKECPPTLEVNSGTICKGECIDLQAKATGGTPPYTYSWSNGPFTSSDKNNVCPIVDTKYVVAVKDSNSCILYRDTAIVKVTDNTTKKTDTAFCQGTNILLQASIKPGATYNWSTNENTPTINVNTPGNWWVTITAAGTCNEIDTFKVKEKPNPVVSLRDTTICSGSNIALDAQNPGAEYQWNTGALNQTITINTAGNYSVTVKKAGCIGQGDVEIKTATTITTRKDTGMCEGQNILLNASAIGTTYLWSTGEAGNQIQANTANIYWVKITNAGTCGKTDTFHVKTRPLPLVILEDKSMCAGEKVIIDAGNPGAIYLWSNGATTQQMITDVPGHYTVSVSVNNCEALGEATFTHLPSPELQVSNDTVVCGNGSVVLTAQGTATAYTWSTKATTHSIEINKSGNYWVNATKDGCVISDTVHVNYFQLTPLGDILLCALPEVDLVAATSGDAYLWNTGETTDHVRITQAGTYWVEITKGTCRVRDTLEATGEYGIPSLFIPNSFTPNGDGINERFTGYGENIRAFEMNIFNRWGDLYFTTNDRNRGWDGTYEGQLVQQDVYVYTIKYETTCGTEILTTNKLGHVSVIR